MAMIAANFTGGEAEDLRRAMGFKRSEQRMQEIEVKLRQGMSRNGIQPETQEEIITANYLFRAVRIPGIACGKFCFVCLCQRLS